MSIPEETHQPNRRTTLRRALDFHDRVTPRPVTPDEREIFERRLGLITSAALGWCKEGDVIDPTLDTPALRDVMQLRVKYNDLLQHCAELITEKQP